MDPRYLAIIPSIVVIVSIFAVFAIRSCLRGFRLPRCCRCGAAKVRRSRPDGFIDAVAALGLLRPFRCAGCRMRYYAPRFLEPASL